MYCPTSLLVGLEIVSWFVLHTPYGGQEELAIEIKYLLEVKIFWSLNLHSMRFRSVGSRCAYPATRHSRSTEVCIPMDTLLCTVLSIPVKKLHEVCHMKFKYTQQ